MHNLKKIKASQKTKANRRHTDAGEHALSILLAKNELGSFSTFSDDRKPYRSPELETAHISNPHAGIFKRIFRSKSCKKTSTVNISSKSNFTILNDSLPLKQSNSSQYISVQDSFIYLLFQDCMYEVSLPSVLTFDWITSSFKSTFNMHFPPDFYANFYFHVKHSNSDNFSPLVELNQISHKSIVSLCSKNDFNLAFHNNLLPNILTSPTPANPSTIGAHSSNPNELSSKLVRERVPLIIHDLSGIRQELHSLKLMNLEFQANYRQRFISTYDSILSEIFKLIVNKSFPTLSSMPDFRIERQKIHSKENRYFNHSSDVYTELELLDFSIENLRLDTQRGCRIVYDEVESLCRSVNDIETDLMNLRNQFLELEPKLRKIMALELEVIVHEEEFVKSEGYRLEESIFKCRHMNDTLIDLRKFSKFQSSKDLNFIEISINPFVYSDVREGLLNEIRNTKIDHSARIKSIELSRQLYFRKKDLMYDPMKAFAKDLQVQRNSLRKTNNLSVITNRNNLNYHKLLEDYKRDKFIRRSNKKLIPNSSSSFTKKVNNVDIFSIGLTPNAISSIIKRKENIEDTYKYVNSNESKYTNFQENSDNYFRNYPPNTSLYRGTLGQNISSHSQQSFLPLVPGPTNISFSSYQYFTRPQEIHVLHSGGSNESSSIQQFSVV